MGLFTRQAVGSPDLRDRHYVLTGCPLVAQDDKVVLVDATVRLHAREPVDGRPVLGFDAQEEAALHAVFVLVLRLLADEVPAEELLVGRARVAEALERGFSFAPVGAGLDATATSVEVRSYDEAAATFHHEFRVG